MADISHAGSVVTISASISTGGAPIILTAFPDDTDPFDIPEVVLAEMELGTNGHLATWYKYTKTEVTLAILPATIDHELMTDLLIANKPELGKLMPRDIITLTRTLPNGELLTLSRGKMVSGSPTAGMASSGRLKTPTFKFEFATMFRTPAVLIDLPI